MNRNHMIHLAQVTHNQPFCAGVLIFYEDTLLITLNSDGLAAGLSNECYRVGGVGGGQEIGETIWECAKREALEEIGAEVELVHSRVTFFHDMDSHSIHEIQAQDCPAPLLFERKSSLTPDKPYKPGLPTGPYVYFNVFLGKVTDLDKITPSDDVEALIFMPLHFWDLLNTRISLTQLTEFGVRIHAKNPMDESRKLWLPPDESFNTVVSLMKKDPNLQSRLKLV